MEASTLSATFRRPGASSAPEAIRVAHCIHGLSLAGAQQVVRHLVEHRSKDKFKYFVYASLDGPLRPEIERAGATVRLLPRRLSLFDPTWAWALRRAMVRDRIDVVHTHLFGDSLHGLLAARLAGLPVVTTLHSNRRGETRLRRWGYDRLLGYMDHVVACSESSRRSYESHLGDRLNVVTIDNGIPPAPSSPAPRERLGEIGIDPRAAVIATVGRHTPEKGFSDLIEAFARLEPGRVGPVQLLFLGDGPLRGSLERQARRAGLGRRVVFAGVRGDVRELLPSFTVVAFSSLYEGMPIAVLEAMAAGRCIVATDAEGIASCLDDRREALLAPRRDPAGLARALEEVLSDPSLRRLLGERAKARFEREFEVGRMVARYEQLYLDVVAGVAAAPPMPEVGVRSRLASASARLGTPAVVRLGRRLSRRPGRAMILFYHRVSRRRSFQGLAVTPGLFQRQMELVRRRARVVTLAVMAERLRDPSPLEEDWLAITFDDGYRDNLEQAAPILNRLGLPATLFVTTDFIDQRRVPFWDRIEHAVTSAWSARLGGGALASLDLGGLEAPARRALEHPGRGEPLEALVTAARRARAAERQRLLAALEELVPPLLPGCGLMLSWEDLRSLLRRGFDVGSHTVSHPSVPELDAERLGNELVLSKLRIEDELQRECAGFAFPWGEHAPEQASALAASGYRYACTVEAGPNHPGGDPWHLRRMPAGFGRPGVLDLKLALARA